MSSEQQQTTGGKSAPLILPKRGVARVKSVLSGDTVVLLGKPLSPNQPPPEVLFTLESLSAPRLSSKSTPVDEPGAFPAREWLRRLCVGKQVSFEVRRQAASAGERIYGWLFIPNPAGGGDTPLHIAVECVRQGHATPKSLKYGAGAEGAAAAAAAVAAVNLDDKSEENEEKVYEASLHKAFQEAKEAKRGIHAAVPTVRKPKNAGDDFEVAALVNDCKKKASQSKIKCVIEYVFDGSRFRAQVVDPDLPDWQYATFTLLLSGITCPRIGNPKASPPTESEEFADKARAFVETRLLQRELPIALLGTDKSATTAVGVVYHPAGDIAVELLKNGLARMTDWSVRLMPPAEVPAMRIAENTAKKTHKGIWHSYTPPKLSGASSITGTVVEVLSGDTMLILPAGKDYKTEDDLKKISLASIRSPRLGNERAGRADEPYAFECKEFLRNLAIGKEVKVEIAYERDIPLQAGAEEKRAFGTFSIGRHDDISELLISEGLAVTQRHRDEDEKSPRYDELLAAEAIAKAAKKGMHQSGEYKGHTVTDLTDPRKAKAYAGSLVRGGKLKGVVDYVFNGGLFKIWIPSENCHIRFSPEYVRCPQPSPAPGNKSGRPGEPFGDESKSFARLHVLQRQVEIDCSTTTNSGILVGSMQMGSGKYTRDYVLELVAAGLGTIDQRKIDYGEAPKHFVDAQTLAQKNKLGVWSVDRPESAAASTKPGSSDKLQETTITVRLSEIRSGSHFFYHVVGDEAAKVMEDSMKLFTQNNGTDGAPCEVKKKSVVAALFDDGTGKSWYRAKIVEKPSDSKVSVLFLDHGNVAEVPIATHLRPLDESLGVDRIPPVAKEAVLALTVTRPLSTDEGMDAAHMFQSLSWGKDLTCRTFAPDDSGKMTVALAVPDEEETINVKLVSEGLARVARPGAAKAIDYAMANGNTVSKLAAELNAAQEKARKSRLGMWRYGDIGDDDDAEI